MNTTPEGRDGAEQVWIGRDMYGRVVGIRDVTVRDGEGRPVYDQGMWRDHNTDWMLTTRLDAEAEQGRA